MASNPALRPDDLRHWDGGWTAEAVIEFLKDYERLYGNSTAASFSISGAKWNDRPELRERYLAGNPLKGGARWPSLNTIKARFGGSFDEARKAAGLKPNKSGPRGGRSYGAHAPVREIRDRLVLLPPERATVALRVAARKDRMVQKARTRTARLERELAGARSKNKQLQAKNARLEAKNAKLQGRLDAAKARIAELEGAAVQMVEDLTA